MQPRRLAVTAALALGLLAPASASAARVGTDGLANEPAARTARAAATTAGEPNLVDQWALTDRAMGIITAWRQVTGGDVTVAVLDSGINLRHRDLAPNLWSNPGEVPGNGVDDDHNGYVDDVNGWDFVAADGDPSDENGHGTHVAGIIGARGDNRVGGSGVAQQVRLMSVRVLDRNAGGTTDVVAKGIRYAVDNGARIVNLSLAGPAATQDLKGAIDYAAARGVLVVAAAGNDSSDLGSRPAYPVSFPEDNLIGVAATDSALKLADISNYGPGADVAAPGADILSTAMDGGYEWRTGTSMAAPAVAGTLALIASARPDLDAAGLRDALYNGVTRGSLPVTYGSVNAAGALRGVIAADAWKDAPATAAAAPKGQLRTAVQTPGAVTRTAAQRAAIAKAARARAGKRCKAVRKRVHGKTVKTLRCTRAKSAKRRK